jgi:hypothetical protein
MTVRYVYQQFNYGTRMTRMVLIFADLDIKNLYKFYDCLCFMPRG